MSQWLVYYCFTHIILIVRRWFGPRGPWLSPWPALNLLRTESQTSESIHSCDHQQVKLCMIYHSLSVSIVFFCKKYEEVLDLWQRLLYNSVGLSNKLEQLWTTMKLKPHPAPFSLLPVATTRTKEEQTDPIDSIEELFPNSLSKGSLFQ